MLHSIIRRLAPILLFACVAVPACNIDEPAKYAPRSGTWTYMPGDMVSDNCNPVLLEPMVTTTFLLDYDEGDEFQIEQGADDIACEIDGTEFFCASYHAGEFPIEGTDAVISYQIQYSGEFMSETEAEGNRASSYTCIGEDCTLFDQIPCSRNFTFMAEFLN